MESEMDQSEKLVVVGEKRAAEDELVGEMMKKRKVRVEKGGELKRVAEICLVLSAMGRMRGGKSPTEVEKELMGEAREKLVELCGEIAPKDVVSKESVRVVMEELGLNNKSKEQRLGFRPPTSSIKEKLELTKKKIEESKKFAAQSGKYTSIPQSGFGPKPESHGGIADTAHKYPPDRPGATGIPVGAFEAASPTVRVSTLGSAPSSNLLPVNEVQSAAQSRVPSGSSPLPRSEVLHFRLDGRANLPTYSSQVRANSSADHLPEKAQTYSAHQSGPVAKLGLVNKVGGVPETNTSQSSQATRDRNSKSPGLQSVHVNTQSANQPLKPVSSMQVPSYSNHHDIAKNVQNFLQPRVREHPNWTPPSTDYMNKILPCQTCGVTINDVESLLVCDACERGIHLKCLLPFNQKRIPINDWHCPRCLMSSNGKPFPPKYGRVTRNISTQKVSANAGVVKASSEAGNSDQKVNHQKITANGNNHVGAPAALKQSNAREMQQARPESKIKMEETHIESKVLPKDTPGEVSIAPSSVPPNRSPSKQVQNGESSPCIPKELKSSEACIDSHHKLQVSCTLQDVSKAAEQKPVDIPENQHHEVKTSDIRETFGRKPENDVRKDDKDAAQTVSGAAAAAVANGARDCLKSTSGGLHGVDWVGDIIQVVDEKAYYHACRVNDLVYKLQDHALFHSNNGNLRPSKIQALWEDTKTGSRWAIVNICSFPADLPEVVGRPCPPESNEVYESNHGSTVRAGLIQGPCDVLPLQKFKEESEKRIDSDVAKNGTRPIYLCNWFYDESKGLFRPVTD